MRCSALASRALPEMLTNHVDVGPDLCNGGAKLISLHSKAFIQCLSSKRSWTLIRPRLRFSRFSRSSGITSPSSCAKHLGSRSRARASKGVFITTSVFTRDAKESAARARGTIVLVDGAMLTSLMMDHGVAVSHQALRIPKVDNDYFEDV
jgi:hypothetical protein